MSIGTTFHSIYENSLHLGAIISGVIGPTALVYYAGSDCWERSKKLDNNGRIYKIFSICLVFAAMVYGLGLYISSISRSVSLKHSLIISIFYFISMGSLFLFYRYETRPYEPIQISHLPIQSDEPAQSNTAAAPSNCAGWNDWLAVLLCAGSIIVAFHEASELVAEPIPNLVAKVMPPPQISSPTLPHSK